MQFIITATVTRESGLNVNRADVMTALEDLIDAAGIGDLTVEDFNGNESEYSVEYTVSAK
jgi:hypothetical protein